ncbi:hypothetical protein OG814_11745 [Streptomyces zaomyceticus]|uniref:Uncharacterized protein n=1 Tax=Streptomyces zaomyceticus TaxID=68286 RepID=A0ABZ1L8D3_9ACTN
MSTRSTAAAGVPRPAPGTSPKAPSTPTAPRPGVAILPVPVVIDGDHDDPCEDR